MCCGRSSGRALPARTSTFWTLSRARESSWFACCDPSRERLHPLGSKGVKAGRGDHAAFQLFSNGWKTGRDAYLYSFSFDALTTKVRQAVSESVERDESCGILLPSATLPMR